MPIYIIRSYHANVIDSIWFDKESADRDFRILDKAHPGEYFCTEWYINDGHEYMLTKRTE